MKRFFKSLAILLAMVLVAGAFPGTAVSAASTVSVKAPTKALYVGGCTGTKANGKKAGNKATLKVKSLLKGFDADKMTLKLTSSDKKIASVSNKTYKVKAVAPGTATITVKVYNKTDKKKAIATSSFEVTVKKNASASDLTIKGITAGETYTVGQSLTVELPKGKDTDKRRLTSANDNATVKSAGTNKWTVKIVKEGAIELLAEAYMSSTYKGATASKTVKATAESEDKPLVIGVEQKTLKSFVISGLQEEIEKEDIEFYTLTSASIKTSKNAYINTVTYDEKTNTATVTTFTDNDLEGGVVYYVDVDGSVANFTAAKATLLDVKKLELDVTDVKVNSNTALSFKYLDANGVDITAKVKSLVNVSNLTLEITPSDSSAFIVGHSITITSDNKTVTVKATLTTGFNTTTNEPINVYGYGIVKSFKESLDITKSLFAVTPDDGIYMTKKDAQSKLTLTLNDTVTLEALFYFTDGSYKNFNEAQYSLSSATPEVLLVGPKNTTGGYALSPNKAGEAKIYIAEGPSYDPDKVIASISVTVLAARKASTFTVQQSKTKLNINTSVYDYLSFTATAFDQYGVKIDGATFSITQDDKSKLATGTFASPHFTLGACTIENTGFTPSGNNGNFVTFNITCDDIENCPAKEFHVQIKDVSPMEDDKIWVPEGTTFVIDGDATIDTMLKNGAQPNDPTSVSAQFSSDGYYVSEGIGKKLTVVPDATLTASKLGISEDTPKLYFTVSLNGKVIDPDDAAYTSLISVYSDSVEFKPFTTGAKLPKGVYTITVYKIKAYEKHSLVTPLASKNITVIDSEPDTYFTKEATTATGTLPGILNSCFKLYYNSVDVTSKIIDVDFTGPDSGSGAVYVRSFTIGGLNSFPYGSFTVKIPIEEFVYIK